MIVLEGGLRDGEEFEIATGCVSLQFPDWQHGQYVARPDGTTDFAFAAITYRDSGRLDRDGRRIFVLGPLCSESAS